MKEIYEKVWIKSENDLPKEQTQCYFHDSITGDIELYTCPSTTRMMQYFTDVCDWYLQPIEPVEQKSAEEVLKYNVPRIEKHPNYEFILKAMEEYASQFKQPVEQLTDEDIEKALLNEIPFSSSSTLNVQRMRWEQGAKWYRDKINNKSK